MKAVEIAMSQLRRIGARPGDEEVYFHPNHVQVLAQSVLDADEIIRESHGYVRLEFGEKVANASKELKWLSKYSSSPADAQPETGVAEPGKKERDVK